MAGVAKPECPALYDCTFTYNPHTPFRGPWWEGPWGIVIAAVVVIGLTIALSIAAYQWYQYRERRAAEAARQRQREHEQFIEEQRTMQLDTAKGDPEALKIVRDMQQSR